MKMMEITLKNLALITIDRAEKHNAISLQTLEELNQAVDFAATDFAIGVIAITGAGGKAFASGSDLNEVLETAHSMLKKGGKLMIEVPLHDMYIENYDYTFWEEHVNYFTKKKIFF